MRSRPQIVAFTAGIVLLGSIAGWLMISAWLDRAPAGEDAQRRMSEQSERNAAAMQEALAEQLSGRQNDAKRQRMDAPLGQALFRRCADWSALYDRQPDASTLDGREAACAEYRRYVLDGTVPD